VTSTTSPPPSDGDGALAPSEELQTEREPAAVLPAGADGVSEADPARPVSAAAPRTPVAPEGSARSGDGFETETVRWRWAALGFAMMAGLHAIVVLVVPGREAIAIGLGLVPYLVGGVALGLLTRGRSMLDAFYGAVGPAMIFPFVVELIRVEGTRPPDVAQVMARMQWLAVLAPTLVYVLTALLGFWVGDQIVRWRRAEPAARARDGKV
jgi:hypothetical protein